MKKRILPLILLCVVLLMSACVQTDDSSDLPEDEIHDAPKTTISGSFTVCVRDVIPNYVFDNTTPSVAIVTQFQCPPFTLDVGPDIAGKLKTDELYVFTIETFTVDYPDKEFIKQMDISSLENEFRDFRITDFRLAEEDETGMNSLCLTIE